MPRRHAKRTVIVGALAGIFLAGFGAWSFSQPFFAQIQPPTLSCTAAGQTCRGNTAPVPTCAGGVQARDIGVCDDASAPGLNDGKCYQCTVSASSAAVSSPKGSIGSCCQNHGNVCIPNVSFSGCSGGYFYAPYVDSTYKEVLIGQQRCNVGCGVVPQSNAVCGNGILEKPEECDDENLKSGDGCDAACREEKGWTCGPVCPPGSPQVTVRSTDPAGVKYTHSGPPGSYLFEIYSPEGASNAAYGGYTWANWTNDSTARIHGGAVLGILNASPVYAPSAGDPAGTRVSNATVRFPPFFFDPPDKNNRTLAANAARGSAQVLSLKTGDYVTFVVNALNGMTGQGAFGTNVGSIVLSVCTPGGGSGGSSSSSRGNSSGGNSSAGGSASSSPICPAPASLGVCANGCQWVSGQLTVDTRCAMGGGVQCGDGFCNGYYGERRDTCPQDCTATSGCGDGICSASEEFATDMVTPNVCAQDCGIAPFVPNAPACTLCGNTLCEPMENACSCPKDCGGGNASSQTGVTSSSSANSTQSSSSVSSSVSTCNNDGSCTINESPTCPDCSGVTSSSAASSTQSFSSAVSSVGTPSTCGNGTCNQPQEHPLNCPADCTGTCNRDDICQTGETISTCIDCMCPAGYSLLQNGGGGTCQSVNLFCPMGVINGATYNDGTCNFACKTCVGGPLCNNRTCDPGETAQSCSFDCGVTGVCGDNICGAGEWHLFCPQDCP